MSLSDYLLNELRQIAERPTLEELRARLRSRSPHLIDVETAQVMRRYAAAGDIDDERGHAALTDLRDFPLRRYPHDFLLPRIWELRNNLTAYDAAYVSLAEALDAPLLTRDRRLAAAAGGHVRVELV